MYYYCLLLLLLLLPGGGSPAPWKARAGRNEANVSFILLLHSQLHRGLIFGIIWQRLSDDNDEVYHKLEKLQQQLGAKNAEMGAKGAEFESMRAHDAQEKLAALARVAELEKEVTRLSTREHDSAAHVTTLEEALNTRARDLEAALNAQKLLFERSQELQSAQHLQQVEGLQALLDGQVKILKS